MFPRPRLAWLHLLFALSGAAGLGLQLTWTRRLALGLGHEVPATFGVITTFLLGLAAGAWLHGRMATLLPRPAVACAALESVAALWAVVTVGMIPWLAGASWHLAGPAPSRGFHWTLCFLLPVIALLPATLALGATLPAMERWISTLRPDGRRVGPLYAANTLGAVAGVIGAVWFVQPNFGLLGATLGFAALHAVCGLGFLVAGQLSENNPASAVDSNARVDADPWSNSRRRRIVTLMVTGFLGLGFEVLVVRLLGQALENTVFTYAAILAVYLLGTALGAALHNRIAPHPISAVPWLLLALAGSLAAAGFLLIITPTTHAQLRTALGDTAVAMMASEGLVAAVVVALPTVFMGLLFSVLTQAERSRSADLGRAVAWNTLGAALAPALVGLGMLPWMGSRGALISLASGYLLLVPRMSSPRWVSLVTVVTALILLPHGLHLQQPPPGTRITALIEGTGDTVTVVETADGHRALRVNNRFTMGGTASLSAERRHSHLPVLLHSKPERALFLGVGTGISFAALDAHIGLTADGVELVPESVALLGSFAPHNRFGNRLTVHIADARRYVRASVTAYDVVIADLFHPARDGAAGLYTVEHFQAVRSRLASGGLFCQWLPLFQLDRPTFQTIVHSFLKVFPQTHAFLLRFNADTPVLGLVGSLDPLLFDPGYFVRRTADPALREALKPVGLTEPWPFFGTWFADADNLRAFAGNAPLNTDDQPVVLFDAPRTLVGTPAPGYTLLEDLLDRPRSPLNALFPSGIRSVETAWLTRLNDYLAARDRYLRGLIAEAKGLSEAAETHYLESVRLSRDFTSGYAQLLTRANLIARSNPAGARRLLDQLTAANPDRPVAHELRTRLGL